MEYIYVFDYSTCEIFTTTVKHDEDVIDVLEAKGLKVDDCYWMISKNPLTIKEL